MIQILRLLRCDLSVLFLRSHTRPLSSPVVPFILPLHLRGYCIGTKPRLWDYKCRVRLTFFCCRDSPANLCLHNWVAVVKKAARGVVWNKELYRLGCQTPTAIKCGGNEMLNNKCQNSPKQDGYPSVKQCSAVCCGQAGKAWSTCTKGERDLAA